MVTQFSETQCAESCLKIRSWSIIQIIWHFCVKYVFFEWKDTYWKYYTNPCRIPPKNPQRWILFCDKSQGGGGSVILAGIHRKRKEGNLLHFSQTAHTATHLLFLKIKIQFGQKLGSIFNAFLLAVCLRLPFIFKWHFTSVIVTSTQRPAA